MRLIFALNCLLQIEQERSEEESSVGDALALAYRCARFCSASLILVASYSPKYVYSSKMPNLQLRLYDTPERSFTAKTGLF